MIFERRLLSLTIVLTAAMLTACGGKDAAETSDAIVVFNAGSLARPLRAALDSFTAGTKIKVEQENAGSVETARKLSELHRIPDLVGSADYQVFPKYLMPAHTTWYARFARNRMVLMYTPKSKSASAIDSTNWYKVLETKGVQTGRSDPALDPNGYRSIIVMKLAELYYKQPGLADRLVANSSAHVVRPKEVDLMGLLQAGEIDYAWSYESVAQAMNLPYVTLPRAIDLSDPAGAAQYELASVRIPGNTPKDTIEIKGEPILYGFTVPRDAPHKALGEKFAAFLVSDAGKRILRREHLDALPVPIYVGDSIPTILTGPSGEKAKPYSTFAIVAPAGTNDWDTDKNGSQRTPTEENRFAVSVFCPCHSSVFVRIQLLVRVFRESTPLYAIANTLFALSSALTSISTSFSSL